MKADQPRISINSISELHRRMGLPKPQHPLVSVIPLSAVNVQEVGELRLVFDFYSILLKRNVQNKIRYGQQYYDFEEGILALLAPKQVLNIEDANEFHVTGWWLVFHPDFIRHYPLSKKIKDYAFFSYAANEALNLSEKEEQQLLSILQSIHREYEAGIDRYSQDVMVSHLDVLLNYVNRFYNRQFLTRKAASSEVLSRLDGLLEAYFSSAQAQEQGLPSVHYLAEQLHLSPHYLSDMLRVETGAPAQQHIHSKLIEAAKDVLASTSLSISEVAYQLGFQHLQSFTKLFKQKTGMTPVQYRHSLA